VTPPPDPLGRSEITGWRLDDRRFASTWDSGEGSFRYGGRWTSKGVRAVYASIDPAGAILEVAVHKGFGILDTVPHVLTSFAIADPARIHLVSIADIPNANWLVPGIPSAGQQQFGDALLARHGCFLIPSVVSRHSWNLVFDPNQMSGHLKKRFQEDFALDTRLHPARA
jgi:RES domain-containing protein